MPVKITRVAAYGLLKKGSKYLITKCANSGSHMPGYWDIPGGTVKYGEKIVAALNREFCEETSQRLNQAGYCMFTAMYQISIGINFK